MKQISQITTLYLPAVDTLQIIVIISSLVLLFKMLTKRISLGRRRWRIRKRSREIESNMWAIE